MNHSNIRKDEMTQPKKLGLSDDLDRFLDPVGELPESLLEPSFGDMLPRGYISVSQATTLIHCPKQWKLRYIDGKAGKWSYRPFEGQNVHRAAEAVGKFKMDTGKMPKVELATDAFSTAFEASKTGVEDWEGIDQGVAKDRGIVLSEIFYASSSTSIRPMVESCLSLA